MKKNFAGQPAGGGQITILTGKDLMTEVKPSHSVFAKRPNFVDNCKNCNMKFKNFDDQEFGYPYGYPDDLNDYSVPDKSSKSVLKGVDWGDWLKTGIDIWSSEQQRRTAEEQAQAALEIERARLAQERARAQTEAEKAKAAEAKAGSVAGAIRAYALPITIVGVLTIGGIAAYFYFKKKKVS